MKEGRGGVFLKGVARSVTPDDVTRVSEGQGLRAPDIGSRALSGHPVAQLEIGKVFHGIMDRCCRCAQGGVTDTPRGEFEMIGSDPIQKLEKFLTGGNGFSKTVDGEVLLTKYLDFVAAQVALEQSLYRRFPGGFYLPQGLFWYNLQSRGGRYEAWVKSLHVYARASFDLMDAHFKASGQIPVYSPERSMSVRKSTYDQMTTFLNGGDGIEGVIGREELLELLRQPYIDVFELTEQWEGVRADPKETSRFLKWLRLALYEYVDTESSVHNKGGRADCLVYAYDQHSTESHSLRAVLNNFSSLPNSLRHPDKSDPMCLPVMVETLADRVDGGLNDALWIVDYKLITHQHDIVVPPLRHAIAMWHKVQAMRQIFAKFDQRFADNEWLVKYDPIRSLMIYTRYPGVRTVQKGARKEVVLGEIPRLMPGQIRTFVISNGPVRPGSTADHWLDASRVIGGGERSLRDDYTMVLKKALRQKARIERRLAK